MSDFIPVLTVAGVPAVLWVVLRYFPQVASGRVVLLAGIVAIVTRDPDRREACHKVLDKVTRRDTRPPVQPGRRSIHRGR